MKKREWIAAAIIIIFAAFAWLITHVTGKEASHLQITVNGEIYGIYALDEDQEIAINDTNVCVIKDGRVSMTEAECPDQICVHTASISRDGGSIVCLPNRIVLEIISEGGGKIKPEVDSISS